MKVLKLMDNLDDGSKDSEEVVGVGVSSVGWEETISGVCAVRIAGSSTDLIRASLFARWRARFSAVAAGIVIVVENGWY